MVAKPSKTKASLPVTRHPLFPVMVGLWFAALFGLGSLAIRPTVLESVVLALRIDLLVPAAAPPLGLTARILLALVLFVVGGLIGMLLARRIAKGSKDRGSLRPAPQSATRQTFTPADDDEDLARLAAARNPPANAIPGRRRALAMEEDFSLNHHDIAPIPGGAPQILDLADLGQFEEIVEDEPASFPAIAEAAAPPPFAAPAPAITVDFVAVDEPAVVATAEPAATFDPWNRHVQPSEPVDAVIEAEAEPAAGAVPFAEFASPAPAPFAPPVFADSVAQLQSGFANPEFVNEQAEAATAPQPEAEAPVFDAPAIDPAPLRASAYRLGQMPADAAAELRAVSVDSLGVVQLAERLALAISRRREAAVQVAAPAAPQLVTPPPLPQPAAAPFAGFAPGLENVATPPAFASPAPSAAPAEIAAEAAAPAAMAMPAALRPLTFDDIEDEPFDHLPQRRLFALPDAPAEAAVPDVSAPVPADADPVGEDEDEAYGSLLDLKAVNRPAFVRIEEPVDDMAAIEPVVIFPGQGMATAPFSNPAPFAAPAAFAAQSEAQAAPVAPQPGHRFDIPPVPGAAAAPRSVDAEETERALKSALATLQRMSGAA